MLNKIKNQPKQTNKINVAIVGATGMVGQAFINILFERKFPINQLYLLASKKSAGKQIVLPSGAKSIVLDAGNFDWSTADIALFSAGAAVAKKLAPKATQSGCIVIDNSSAFRLDENIPLIIPEINSTCLKKYSSNIIANPNCSTIQLLLALYPIYLKAGLKKIIVSTYQAASGAGSELMNQLKQGKSPLAFNVMPQIDELDKNGYTREEMKIALETQKIFQDNKIKISATAVRVPVLNGHSEAVTIETAKPLGALEAIELLKSATPGVCYQKQWMTPAETSGKDAVNVSRVRNSLVFKNGLDLWVVADNIRKGAALNAIQIAEYLIHSV